MPVTVLDAEVCHFPNIRPFRENLENMSLLKISMKKGEKIVY